MPFFCLAVFSDNIIRNDKSLAVSKDLQLSSHSILTFTFRKTE